jgi:hypothetical protein
MGTVPKNLNKKGFVWIHLKCFLEITELKDDIKSVKEILAGQKNETVERFLQRMEQFDAHFERLAEKLQFIQE